MESIIKSFKYLNESVLKSLICTVELLTYTNLIAQLGWSASEKISKVLNQGSSEKNTEDHMTQKNNELLSELNMLSKSELMLRLILAIEDRLKAQYNFKTTDKFNMSLLEDALIDSAAKKYKFKNLTTNEEKIASIKIEVEKEMKEIRIKNSDLNAKEEREMEQAIQEELENLTPEEEREIKEQLKIDELSGKAIKELLTKSGGALSLMMISTLAGFSSYIALTTIMHAIFTTVLGITLPFAAYTSATTLMSILAGPVGWIGFSGITIFTLRKNKDKLTQAVMAQIVGITAIFTETVEDHYSLLPNWLSSNQKNEMLDIKNKLDAEQKVVERLLVEKEELENIRNKALVEAKKLENEISNLNNMKEDSEEKQVLLEKHIKDRETELENYKQSEKKTEQIVEQLATSNHIIKSHVELSSNYLLSSNAKDKNGALGELNVYNYVLESVSYKTFAVAQPQLGEKSPDILVIHPEKGFRLIEVKNIHLGSIHGIESNNTFKTKFGGKDGVMNPLKQVESHRNQLFSYLSNNYPELGDQYRNIGYCVVHFGFTRQEFSDKFAQSINRWDEESKNEFFKVNIFKDELEGGSFAEKIWNARKFYNKFSPLEEHTINNILVSTNVNSYFE